MSSYGTATAISLFIILSVAPGDLRAGAVLDDARALLSEQRYEDVSTLLADASVEPSEEPARRLYLGVALRSLTGATTRSSTS